MKKINKSSKTNNFLNQKTNNKNQLWLLGLLILTTFVVYANALSNLFVDWDDIEYIKDNPYINFTSLKEIANIFTSSYYYNYHPLTTLSWAIEFKLFGLNPFYYHLDNVLLHLMNVVLVLYFVRKLSKRFEISIIIAALFALHPMHVESVSWISERKDLLYALFYLCSMISYLSYVQSESKKKHWWLALFFFILSLLSKSMAITLPAILLLLDYYLKRPFSWKIILEKIPFAILSVLFVGITLYSQFYQYGDVAKVNEVVVFNIFDKVLLAIYGIVFYIFHLVLPINLSALHPYPTKINTYLPTIYYLAPFILSLFILLVVKIKNHKRELIFGLLFFLFSISIVLQLIPVGHAVVAERYTYIPYLGLLFIMGSFYQHYIDNNIKKTGKRSSIARTTIFIILILFSILSFNRNAVWKNTKTLFTDVAIKYPNDYFSYFALGNFEASENNLNKATTYYEKSIALNSHNATLFNNYALIKYKTNENNAAILNFNKAILMNNKYFEAYINRGNAYLSIKQYNKAIADFTFVINHQQKGTDKYEAYYNRALAYYNLNDFKNSLINCDSAISINPTNPKFYNNRALTKLKLDDIKGAIDDYTKAITSNDSDIQLYFNRAIAYTKQNDLKNALQDYSKCLQLKSDYFEAFYNRGNIYVTLSNYAEAIKDFTKAIELNPNYISFYINRANAYFQSGNLSGACSDWNKAKNMGNLQVNDLLSKHCK